MSFFEEVKQMLKISDDYQDLLITYMPSKGAVVQGYKKILKIEEDYVSVLSKNKRVIYVYGKNLQISSLSFSELVIAGKIDYVGEKHE